MTEFRVYQLKKSTGKKVILKSDYFEVDGQWLRPENLDGNTVYITAIGGGSCVNATAAYNGSVYAGDSGEFVIEKPIDISSVAEGENVAVTVGAGGNNLTLNGSSSSFGSFITVAGGGATEKGNKGGYSYTVDQIISDGIGAAPFRAFSYNGGNKAPGGAGGLLGFGDCIVADPSHFCGPTGTGHGAGAGGLYGTNNENPARPGIVVVSYYVEVA
ncbi:hypothetical protein SG34_010615 [Thalassomonas viridans]|uniref:Uncharacterized protein n=1 Tax=Thalassomonas viridans TaxID=137584 RepID=A0AAE9Z8L8_9GAMM|nr:hypothetical protein [Thalassomonas viridans]WDE07298.1 hypothetical protein SG34_010615 [Thalassomonas viridans]